MKLTNFVLLIATLALAAAAIMYRGAVRAAQPIPFPDLLVVQAQSDFNGEYKVAWATTHMVAIRANGSWAEWDQVVDPRGANLYAFRKWILDFEAGRNTVVDELAQSLTTVKLKNGESYPGRRIVPAALCEGVADGEILGYKVMRLDSESYSNDEHQLLSTWAAPGIGCFALKFHLVVEKMVGGAWVLDLDSTRVTTRVQVGPVDFYFTLPNYPEMSPSAERAKLAELYPTMFPPMKPEQAATKDNLYYSNRP